jgi:hypothetical protein
MNQEYHSHPTTANKEVEAIKYMVDSIDGVHILQNKAILYIR